MLVLLQTSLWFGLTLSSLNTNLLVISSVLPCKYFDSILKMDAPKLYSSYTGTISPHFLNCICHEYSIKKLTLN